MRKYVVIDKKTNRVIATGESDFTYKSLQEVTIKKVKDIPNIFKNHWFWSISKRKIVQGKENPNHLSLIKKTKVKRTK